MWRAADPTFKDNYGNDLDHMRALVTALHVKSPNDLVDAPADHAQRFEAASEDLGTVVAPTSTCAAEIEAAHMERPRAKFG